MCLDSGKRARSPPDEESSTDASFSLYCESVEWYNEIQQRAKKDPFFLQRCLHYKIHARRKRRIQITISLSGSRNTEINAQNIFPLYVLLARPTRDILLEGNSPIYRFNRICLLTSFSEFGNKDDTEASFIIPDVMNLSSSHPRNLNIILLSCGEFGQIFAEDNCSGNDVEGSSLQKAEGLCSWGKIPTNLFASSLENCATLSLGHTVEFLSTVTMKTSSLDPKFLKRDSCLTFCSHESAAAGSYKLQVCISAQEAGAKDMSLSPYCRYSYDDVPSLSLPEIIRLRAGNVLFNYKYANNMMKKTEVTEDFRCPFCLVRCGSFKGLGCHLNASHDRFHFEFWISEECQAVNVSLKTDARRTELVPEGADPRQHQSFSYRSRFKKTKIRSVQSHFMEADDSVQRENGQVSINPPQHGSNLSPPIVEQAEPRNRNRQLLQKRQFFHSRTHQPMAPEQVFSDHDSEDEMDDDIADFEDRKSLDDYLGVTKDEKLIMHMWNSFVRKQRVRADGHVPWACKEFSKLHGKFLAECPAVLMCWRLLMVKFWNHNLLSARDMDKCSIILQAYQNEISKPK